ncbi:hypothetical protein [Rhizobacter sp. Root1221]|uniref:phage nozzle protein n=1 Tax=Rhizobacter sp. Root1221 TaxID=1736433 RepID=UPI0006F232D9|nr:hypothetical protein [Rhizobacter sp. Root1221]KQV99970.1 hypothetical protein ASC87_19915 [Rhizobacter sp. Root1221]
MDGLLQPRIGGLYHGVSRQAPLQRSPSQMEELDNYLPSVDLGGFVDREGTRLIVGVPSGGYKPQATHFFRTTDGSAWSVMRKAGDGELEVRSLNTGIAATITYGPWVQQYLGASSASLRFLTVLDTVFILNTDVTAAAVSAAKPAATSIYLVVRKLSQAAQNFTATSSAGTAIFSVPQNSSMSRDFACLNLSARINQLMPGVDAFRVAPNVIRVTATAEILDSFSFTNDWDETSSLCVKGRVQALSDLPGVFDQGVPLLVDLGSGSGSSQYYVTYDAVLNAWIESSYLPTKAATCTLTPGSMPIRLHQTGPAAFELQPCDWATRKVGDDVTNPVPGFIGKRITALANWKGRMWFAAGDSVYSSRPDDLYSFFRGSARIVAADDPVKLETDAPDVAGIDWLVAFRSKLMVLSSNAQQEVAGDKPITPTDAVLGVATRYQIDPKCEPRAIGDSLYYTGESLGRTTLFEYQYDETTANNTAEDLSKHVPKYIQGRAVRLRGSALAGRVFMSTDSMPSTLFVHTGHWKDGQRVQNAWSKVTFDVTRILSFWVDQDVLYIIGELAGNTVWLSVNVQAGTGTVPEDEYRLDFGSVVQLTWDVQTNRSWAVLPEAFRPAGLYGAPALEYVLLVDKGEGWFREYPVTTALSGAQWIAFTPRDVQSDQGYLGVRFERSGTFSPFYATVGDKTTPQGRLQVSQVVLDTLVSGDFQAVVTRPDRVPMVKPMSPRIIDQTPVPRLGENGQFPVPFNATGHKARLTVRTKSSAPMCITGLTLKARYTNPTAK